MLRRSLFLLGCMLLLSVDSVAQTAVLQTIDDRPAIAISVKGLRSGAVPEAALFRVDSGVLIKDFSLLTKSPSNENTYILTLATDQFDRTKNYQVIVRFITDKDQTAINVIPVMPGISVVLRTEPTFCSQGLWVSARATLKGTGNNYDWKPLFAWLGTFASDKRGIATVQIQSGGKTEDYALTTFSHDSSLFGTQATNLFNICLETQKPLPVDTFTAKVGFTGKPPVDFGPTLTAKGLKGNTAVPPVTNESIVAPEKRSIDRSLDLGLSFTSSVTAKTPTAANPHPLPTRGNQGVLDLRFEPIMDVVHPIIKENTLLTFLTPLFINANVSTGPITQSTLALNDVQIGTLGEFRYYQTHRVKLENNPDTDYKTVLSIWHRVIWSLASISDRDFKQAEFDGKLQYAPIFDALYKPIAFNWKPGPDGSQKFGTFGYAFKPNIGFEIGKTYETRNPAAAIKPVGPIRRLSFGADVELDITRLVTLSASDAFYVRGETTIQRYRNHFIGTVQANLGKPNTIRSQAVFFSFERGNVPPFDTPTVNALKVGYRILANFCGDHCR